MFCPLKHSRLFPIPAKDRNYQEQLEPFGRGIQPMPPLQTSISLYPTEKSQLAQGGAGDTRETVPPWSLQNQGKRRTPYKETRSASFPTLVHQTHTVNLSDREKRIQRSGTFEQRISFIKVKLVRRNRITLCVYMCWALC